MYSRKIRAGWKLIEKKITMHEKKLIKQAEKKHKPLMHVSTPTLENFVENYVENNATVKGSNNNAEDNIDNNSSNKNEINILKFENDYNNSKNKNDNENDNNNSDNIENNVDGNGNNNNENNNNKTKIQKLTKNQNPSTTSSPSLLHKQKTIIDKNNFIFSDSLPKEFWFIFEQSNEFKFGNGLQNEDELDDYRLEEIEKAKKAKQEALKFENYLMEERLRREAEELAR
jgi:hypothetical protein